MRSLNHRQGGSDPLLGIGDRGLATNPPLAPPRRGSQKGGEGEKLRTMDCGLWTVDYGLWTNDQ